LIAACNAARGPVEAAVEVELQRDIGSADRALRAHLGDVGYDAEVAFERRRHDRRHCLGADARFDRRHGNGRIIDPRQRRHRNPKNPASKTPMVSKMVATGRAMNGADGFTLRRPRGSTSRSSLLCLITPSRELETWSFASEPPSRRTANRRVRPPIDTDY
jgi:hypothetical protein